MVEDFIDSSIFFLLRLQSFRISNRFFCDFRSWPENEFLPLVVARSIRTTARNKSLFTINIISISFVVYIIHSRHTQHTYILLVFNRIANIYLFNTPNSTNLIMVILFVCTKKNEMLGLIFVQRGNALPNF